MDCLGIFALLIKQHGNSCTDAQIQYRGLLAGERYQLNFAQLGRRGQVKCGSRNMAA